MISEVSFPGLGIDPFQISPAAISFGPFTVMWYGLIICCGMILAFGYIWYRAKQAKLNTDALFDLVVVTVCVAIFGARLYYVVFDGISEYIVTDYGFFKNLWKSFYNIIAIWEGGLAIYGGILFGTLTVFLMARRKKLHFFQIADIAAPAVMLAQAIGRWGNFMNGEAFGSETTLPWRMGLCNHHTGYMTMYVHPTFLYESLWNILGFVLINIFYKKRKFDGEAFLWYFIWYGFGRTFIELLRTDSLMLGPIRVSSMLAALIVLTMLPLLIFLRIREHQMAKAGTLPVCGRPGVLYLLTEGKKGAYPTPAIKTIEKIKENTAEEPSAQTEETENGQDH